MSQAAQSIGEEQAIPALDQLLKDIQALDALIATWDEQHQQTVHALKKGIDALHREALVRMIRALREDDNASSILHDLMQDEAVYAVFRHLNIVKASLDERVEAALESVRPYLQSHGGDVELVDIVPPNTVTVRLVGACDGCPASGLTLQEGVEKAIKEHCPEITSIIKAKGGVTAQPADGVVTVNFVSPFARVEDRGWVYACGYEDIPENNIKVVVVAGHSIILSRVDDEVSCFENACAHLGMPMDMGEVKDGILICPHHLFEYLLKTGECLTAPEVQLETHAVRVMKDRVEVKLL